MSEIFIILILILLNGLFSMSELAILSSRKSNLQLAANKGNKSAKLALKLASDPDKFLSSVQIGITLIGILTGVFSGNKLTIYLGDLLAKCGLIESVASGLAQMIIVIVVTYFSIVFGELLPKRIALAQSEAVAKFLAAPMRFISIIAAPFVWVLSRSTYFLSRLFGIKNKESKITEEEIKTIIQEGTDEGEVLPLEQDIVERVFALGDLKVSTIMTLRSDVTWLEIDMSEEKIRETIENNLYEEYPVADGGLDHVIGILSLKEFVINIGREGFSLRKMIKEPTYFHENMSVYSVLENMKAKRISRALVCDEFGSCSGIITLKDIMEGLIGTINDSNEKEPDIVQRQDNNSWLVDGQCSMFDFFQHFDMDDSILQEYEFSTLAGLILDELGYVPKVGEKIEWSGFNIEIVDMDGARIDKLIVTELETLSE